VNLYGDTIQMLFRVIGYISCKRTIRNRATMQKLSGYIKQI